MLRNPSIQTIGTTPVVCDSFNDTDRAKLTKTSLHDAVMAKVGTIMMGPINTIGGGLAA
jgi:hypothetical protein